MMRKIHKIYPDKSRGQNFLIDKNVLAKIVAAADLSKKDTVIEIGAGTGILTAELAKRAGRVVAFEIDKKLAGLLKEKFKDFKKVEIIEKDIMDIKDIKDINIQYPISNYKLVANIPYNITSAVLEKFLLADRRGGVTPPLLMVLLVQKEVAERICAKPGEMSVLSVMVQYYGKPRIIARVPASAFWPRPKVESAILKIKDIKEITEIKDIDFERKFFKIVNAGFSRRRKMLKNNLVEANGRSPLQIVGILAKVGLPPSVRAQELGVEDWVKLAKVY